MSLSDPLPLPCGGELPNRIAKSAMSEQLAGPGGAPTRSLVRLYERWARGGAGLLVTGNVMIDGRALGERRNVVLEDDRHLAVFTRWAAAGRQGGGQIWMQLNHPGRQSPRNVSSAPVAPSAVPVSGMFGAFAMPRELTDAEILDLVERFGRSAALAKQAGFDGVQLHAAHGYLVSQFLSPQTNRRTDAWGGDAERRRRFIVEVVRSMRAAVGPDFPVGVKLNSADFQRGGFTEEESIEVVVALQAEGIDLLEISGGTFESPKMMGEATPARESTRKREAYFLDYARRIRAHTTLPLMVTGGFRTLDGMVDAVESGATDVVGMARPLAVEPDLPVGLLNGTVEGARPIRLASGWRKLDDFVQMAWYQAQIRRMAAGGEPAPDLTRLASALAYPFGAQA